MASQTTYYEFNKPAGSDLVNPLVDQIPNWDKADNALHGLSVNSIGTATEVVALGVHALTRVHQPDAKFIQFIATGDYDAGETFTLDGVAIAAAYPDGSPLAEDAYVTGATVLIGLNADNSVATFYLSKTGGTAPDSLRLGGELPAYYATKSYADGIKTTADNAASAIAKKALVNTYYDTSDNKLYRVLSDGTIGGEIKMSRVLDFDNAVLLTGTLNYTTLKSGALYGIARSTGSSSSELYIDGKGVGYIAGSGTGSGNINPIYIDGIDVGSVITTTVSITGSLTTQPSLYFIPYKD